MSLHTVSLAPARRRVSRRMRQGDKQVLCQLVRPEAQRTSRTFHDSFWAKTTEDAGLVVLAGVEVGDHGVVGSRQLRLACWTPSLVRGVPVETGAAGAVNAKDVTVGFCASALMAHEANVRKAEYLQVVTSALSRRSRRHFVLLHLRACSMPVTDVKARLWWSSEGASMFVTPRRCVVVGSHFRNEVRFVTAVSQKKAQELQLIESVHPWEVLRDFHIGTRLCRDTAGGTSESLVSLLVPPHLIPGVGYLPAQPAYLSRPWQRPHPPHAPLTVAEA